MYNWLDKIKNVDMTDWTDDDIVDFCQQSDIPVREFFSHMYEEDAKNTPCENCRHIAYRHSSMYPCNSCTRCSQDRFEPLDPAAVPSKGPTLRLRICDLQLVAAITPRPELGPNLSEMSITVETDNGEVLQDICTVRPSLTHYVQKHRTDCCVWVDCCVWKDLNDTDCTDEFTISIDRSRLSDK